MKGKGVCSFFDRFFAERLKGFFMGPVYPVIVAFMMLCGYYSGLELYFHFVNMTLVAIALCVCDSLRPLIIVISTFVFQISREHTPSTNNISGIASDYFFTEWRGVALIISFVVVFVALCVFFIKNRLITVKRLTSLPFLIPSAILATAFLLNGAFSDSWEIDSLGFAAVQCVMWFVIFYVLLLGFSKEKGEQLVDYLVYVSSVIVILLVVQLLEIYLFSGELILPDGSFNRYAIVYGWGVTNTAAQSLTVTIPIMALGAVRGRGRLYYLIMMGVVFFASVFNLSRTALLVGLPLYVACIIIVYRRSLDRKRCMHEIMGIVGAVVLLLLVFNKWLFPAIGNYLTRGVDDSGRFNIWKNSLIAFREQWLSGKGFFGLSKHLGGWSNTSFIPYMAHNTPVHILGCCGIIGFIAYVYYRVRTAIPFFKKRNTTKTLLGLSLLSVLLGSLLENFVFYILPMLYYSAVFAVSCRLIEEENDQKQ